MEKPGIEPMTPGLQGIALIHYTTAASLVSIDNNRQQELCRSKQSYFYQLTMGRSYKKLNASRDITQFDLVV